MKYFKSLLLLLVILLPRLGWTQILPGYSSGNYGGISSAEFNPAFLADSRYKFDMTLGGGGMTFSNNFAGVKTRDLMNGKMFKEGYFGDDFRRRIKFTDTMERGVAMHLSGYATLPSFMLSLTPKIAIGMTTSLRMGFGIDNITPELARLAMNGNKLPEYYKVELDNDQLSINAMAWYQVGLSYAQILNSNGPHFFKAGGTLNLIKGVEAVYLYGQDLTYRWQDKNHLDLIKSKFGYGHSDNFELTPEGKYKVLLNPISNPTFGLNLGAVYEYRPDDPENFTYEMNGKTNLPRRDLNKYKYRISASLVDLGRIKFHKGNLSNDFEAEVSNWDLRTLKLKDRKDKDIILQVDSTLGNKVGITYHNEDPNFNMVLPAALNLDFDYHIYKGFYAEALTHTGVNVFSDAHRIFTMNYYRLIPRWESKWFGVYMPFSVNGYREFQQGLTLRLGPVVFGSNDISPVLWKKNIRGADFHFALKIPILFGKPPRDRDGDKVSDKVDKCRDIKGLWEFKGCPDRDKDGVPDNEDKCPEVKGSKDLQGCPDRDKDGIIDSKDDCPDLKGSKELNGCPDTDGDGIIDPKDSCPTEKGLPFLFGCPDKDGDSVPDKDDKCPDLKGSKAHFGCPDTDGDGVYDNADDCKNVKGPVENKGCPYPDADGDGVFDKDDKCPNTAGPVENLGCPFSDADGDGVLDKDDKCPNTPGPKDNAGCPRIEKKVQQVIDSAYADLEFEKGSDKIKETSYESLDRLAGLLLKNPTWMLKLSGHTDNSGTAAQNLELSRKRALAVKTYVTSKGVEPKAIIVEYFGATKPLVPNTTEANKARNRRVEMKLKFR